MGTAGELQRQIALLDGLRVELFSAFGRVLDPDEELAVDWPYVRRAPGRLTLEEWRVSRIAPLRPDLQVWAMAGTGYPIDDTATVKKARASIHREALEEVLTTVFRIPHDSGSVVVADRDVDIESPVVAAATVSKGKRRLMIRTSRTGRHPITVAVDHHHVGGLKELHDGIVQTPSRVLRVQAAPGRYTDIPCKDPRVTVYADREIDPGYVLVVVDRWPSEPHVPVEVSGVNARPGSELERRLAVGAAWRTVSGTLRHWRREDLQAKVFRGALERRRTFPVPAALVADPDAGPWSDSWPRKKSKRKSTTNRLLTLSASREPFVLSTDSLERRRLSGLLQTAELVSELDLEVVGRELVAGRLCDVVEASLRADCLRTGLRHVLGPFGAHFRLSIDVERLVVLRALKLIGGQVAEGIEFLHVTFDEPLT